MPAQIHINDTGTVLLCTVLDENESVVDLSTASQLQIILKKPGCGDVLNKTAQLYTDGTDGKMKYTTVSGDLDRRGTWELQGFVRIGTSFWSSDISKFDVWPNL